MLIGSSEPPQCTRGASENVGGNGAWPVARRSMMEHAEQDHAFATETSAVRNHACAGPFRLRLLPPPLELPGSTVVAAWHPRAQDDPAHAWFRTALVSVAKT